MTNRHDDLRGAVPLGPKQQTPTHAAAEIATLARHADGNGLIPLTPEGRMARSMVMSGEELIGETLAGVSSLLDPLRVDLALAVRAAVAGGPSYRDLVEAISGTWHQHDESRGVAAAFCAFCDGDHVTLAAGAGRIDGFDVVHFEDCVVVRLGLTELQPAADPSEDHGRLYTPAEMAAFAAMPLACPGCHRRAGAELLGEVCGMTQPDGSTCQGVFEAQPEG